MQRQIRQHSKLQSAPAHTGTPEAYELIRIARTWIDTPFRHQGRIKGVGVDCAGLLVGVGKEGGYAVQDVAGYPRLPSDDTMFRVISEQCERSKTIELSSILFIKYGGTLHLAMVSRLNPVYIIHAFQKSGKVIEHRLDDKWAKRVKAVFKWPS